MLYHWTKKWGAGQDANDFATVAARRHVTEETGHGRQETRSSIQMPVPQNLPGLELWKGLKSIGMVVSECLRNGKEMVEIRYYISSLAVSVKRFATCDPQSLGH